MGYFSKLIDKKRVLRYTMIVILTNFMTVVRSTVSFVESNWKKIAKAKNKSKVVNDAIAYYFAAKDYLKEKEEEFILGELKHYQETGEAYTFEETFNK